MTAFKMDAYDYTIGDLNGQLTYVSPDTLLDQTVMKAFRSIAARWKVCPTLKRPILIRYSGMTASVEINTGSNTVLSYLTKPLTKTLSEALAERGKHQ